MPYDPYTAMPLIPFDERLIQPDGSIPIGPGTLLPRFDPMLPYPTPAGPSRFVSCNQCVSAASPPPPSLKSDLHRLQAAVNGRLSVLDELLHKLRASLEPVSAARPMPGAIASGSAQSTQTRSELVDLVAEFEAQVHLRFGGITDRVESMIDELQL